MTIEGKERTEMENTIEKSAMNEKEEMSGRGDNKSEMKGHGKQTRSD